MGTNANTKQVGGTHYAGEYQHWDLVRDVYEDDYLKGNATKYIVRHRKKNGRQDVEKAKHYVQKLQERWSHEEQASLTTPQRFVGRAMEIARGVARFCHIHQIDATEHNLLLMLAYADKSEELDEVLALLDELLAREYPCAADNSAEEPVGRGYVAQD